MLMINGEFNAKSYVNIKNNIFCAIKKYVYPITSDNTSRNTIHIFLLVNILSFCLITFTGKTLSNEHTADHYYMEYPELLTHADLHEIEGQEWPFQFSDLHIVNELGKGLHAIILEISNGGKPYILKLYRPETDIEHRDIEISVLKEIPPNKNMLTLIAYYTDESGKVIGAVMEKARCTMRVMRANNCDSFLPHHKDIQRYIKGIFTAIEVLHRQNFKHGDIYDSNIMLGENGEMKLIDFNYVQRKTTKTYAHDIKDALSLIIRYVEEYNSLINTRDSNLLHQELTDISMSLRYKKLSHRDTFAAIDMLKNLPSLNIDEPEDR